MVNVEKSLVIAASRERVFAFLVEHAPEWVPRSLFGAEYASEASVGDLVPRRRFAWRQAEGDFARAEGTVDVEDAPSGTRVRFRATVEPPFVLPRMATEAEVASLVSRRYDRALLGAKRTLEA
ncbi:MAG: SRPBCC family protein [Thermoplasmatota archaeon]